MDMFNTTVVSIDMLLSSYSMNQIPDFFFKVAPLGTEIQKWYAAKLLKWAEGDVAAEEVTAECSRKEHDIDLDFLGQFLDLDDNLWLQGLLSPNESGSFAMNL